MLDQPRKSVRSVALLSILLVPFATAGCTGDANEAGAESSDAAVDGPPEKEYWAEAEKVRREASLDTLVGDLSLPEVTPPEVTSPRPSDAEDVEFVSVQLFYATDRAHKDRGWLRYLRLFLWPALLSVLGLLVVVPALKWLLKQRHRRIVKGVRVIFILGVCGMFAQSVFRCVRQGQRHMRLDVEYGSARSNGRLELGICEVTVPIKVHEEGVVEVPVLSKGEIFDDPARHMILKAVWPVDGGVFFDALENRISGATNRDAFVFVHGFNNTFEYAVLRTAQIAYDLGFQGAPIVYSWPSQGRVADYPVDETNAAWSIQHLEGFLRRLRAESNAETIHLVAHSMGCYVLSMALNRLEEPTDGEPLFNEIVLAAPDIDADTFKTDIAPKMVPRAKRITLYVSSKDLALEVSAQFHGRPRAGQAGKQIVVVENIDTIDVSQVASGHSYIAHSGRILRDLLALLLHDRSPGPLFGMLEKMSGSLSYWILEKGDESG